MTTPIAVTVDETGIHVPDLAAIVAYLQDAYRGIYGQDIAFDSSDQDTQWLGIFAAALNDAYAMAVGVYNSFSPATAQGVGLSSVVKVNGIKRQAASYSTVDIVNVGQAGRTIRSPKVKDDAGNIWTMPDFTIPFSGEVTVTATCTVLGAVAAPAGTQWSIAAPQIGWQSVRNAAAGTPGAPVERDPELRVRQSRSTMLPALTVLDGIEAAILAVSGVSRLKVYENDTSVTDANGIPGHTISVVVDGGDALAICQAIAARKTPGAGTYGNASQVVVNAFGVPRQINYFRPHEPPISVNIVVRSLNGYTLDDETAIRQAVSDWVNALDIGQAVLVKRLYGPALLIGTARASRFEIVTITVARDGSVTKEADVSMAFNEAAFCLPDYVTIGYVS